MHLFLDFHISINVWIIPVMTSQGVLYQVGKDEGGLQRLAKLKVDGSGERWVWYIIFPCFLLSKYIDLSLVTFPNQLLQWKIVG